MFDARLRPLIDPPLNAAGRRLARFGVSANVMTLAGVVVGIGAGVAISQTLYWLALVLIVVNRIADGLDGAIARAAGGSDFGGYLDIVCDFAFYVAVPVGFGFADPDNLAAALILVACFTLTGVSFLAFAIHAAKRGAETAAHGMKSFFYSTGLAEGAETIAVFVALCLLPGWFAPIALGYASLCIVTVIQRSAMAASAFGNLEGH